MSLGRIAVYGGSFNPPHLGHVLCATSALAMHALDELWVLPVARHPYAKDLPPLASRLAWCRAAFADLRRVQVRDDEARNTTGYTVDLIELLMAEHPGVRFCLVLGTDTARDIGHWKRGAHLQSLVDIITIPRRGIDDAHPAALPAISSSQVRALAAAGQATAELLPLGVQALWPA